MWNDTDEPVAYFITFRTYGTWLHGDARGSVNRFRNKYKSDRLPKESKWLEVNAARLKSEPVLLNPRQRASVRKAVKETCRIRGWTVHALNVRTNHIHLVITAKSTTISIVLNAVKANSTRVMRERNVWKSHRSPWSDKGSTRLLWNAKSVDKACHYVRHEQGDDLPEFE